MDKYSAILGCHYVFLATNHWISTMSFSYGNVNTLHILKTGEVISSHDQYQYVEDRFTWVDKPAIISRILRLRLITESHKRTIIAIYEDGQVIKEYVNVDDYFTPLLHAY